MYVTGPDGKVVSFNYHNDDSDEELSEQKDRF